MKIGIGIPNPVAGYQHYPGTRLVEWSRRAEDRGFTGLATIDRVVYPSYDTLTSLAAAAGATSRIGLASNVLLAPLYPTPLLAKAAATIDQVSGGRFTLGLAPGGRDDDYAALESDFGNRGKVFDEQLDELHRLWRGEPATEGGPAVTPPPVNDSRVPVLVGGRGKPAIRRGVEWGDGFTIGGAPPEQAAPLVEQMRTAWRDGGRDGEPRIAALAYYSLGVESEEPSRGYLRHYYGFLGEYGEMIAEGAHRTETAIKDVVRKWADLGVAELYLDPTTCELDQVDRLADLVL